MNETEHEEWYIVLEDGMYVGYTSSFHIATMYKQYNTMSPYDVVIERYESPKDVVESIVYDRFGLLMTDFYLIKPYKSANGRVTILSSKHRLEQYLYGQYDICYEIDNLVVSIYRIADVLDYFVDGDKLRTIIKIIIIKYLAKVLDIYYNGYVVTDKAPIDDIYILAKNELVVVLNEEK